MAYWLIKTEPQEYSWEMLERDKTTTWTGVRNFAARKNLSAMRIGDFVFVYHTGDEKLILGVARVISDPKPDPTAEEGEWVCVDLAAHVSLLRPVSLAEMQNSPNFFTMTIMNQPRLSVHSVTDDHAQLLLKIAKTTV